MRSRLVKLAKLMSCVGNPLFRRALLVKRVAAAVEHLPVLSLLAEFGTVVDIGANKGQFALVARSCFPRALIHSFEPLPDPAAIFRKIFAGDPHTTLYPNAIGPTRGTAPIHLSAREDSSSLLPITRAQSLLFPGTEETGVTTIDVGLLHDYLDRSSIIAPALLKLDVQGYELSVLKGCQVLLDQFTHVYAECSFVELYEGQALANEVIDWLRASDFTLSGIYNLTYGTDGKAIQGDFLFCRLLPT